MQYSNKIGTVVDGKFQILSVLGSGGFGIVYKAEQLDMSRTVALKIIAEPSSEREERIGRFEREAKILSSLQHPNVVPVYAYGVAESGERYLAMQYLEGETLTALLDREKKLDWRRAVHIGVQVCQAAGAAHKAGIIHRDIKPLNIMITAGDNVRVLDFGLAGLTEGTPMQIQRLTQTGALIGTVHYMSPELCRGMRADARSDIYSIGCVLYQALSGRAMFEEDSGMEIVYKHATDLPPRLSGTDSNVPEWLERVIFKSLQKEPDDRYQTAEEFAGALNLGHSGRHAELALDDVKLESKKAAGGNAKGVLKLLLIVAVAVVIAGVGAVKFFAQQKNSIMADPHQPGPGFRYRMVDPDAIEALPSNLKLAAYRKLIETGLRKYDQSKTEQILLNMRSHCNYKAEGDNQYAFEYSKLLEKAIDEFAPFWSQNLAAYWYSKLDRFSMISFFGTKRYQDCIDRCRKQEKRVVKYPPEIIRQLDLNNCYLLAMESALELGKLSEAEEFARKALADLPNNAKSSMPALLVNHRLALARVLLREGQPQQIEQAKALVHSCTEIIPQITELKRAMTSTGIAQFESAYKQSGLKIPQIDADMKILSASLKASGG